MPLLCKVEFNLDWFDLLANKTIFGLTRHTRSVVEWIERLQLKR